MPVAEAERAACLALELSDFVCNTKEQWKMRREQTSTGAYDLAALIKASSSETV